MNEFSSMDENIKRAQKREAEIKSYTAELENLYLSLKPEIKRLTLDYYQYLGSKIPRNAKELSSNVAINFVIFYDHHRSIHFGLELNNKGVIVSEPNKDKLKEYFIEAGKLKQNNPTDFLKYQVSKETIKSQFMNRIEYILNIYKVIPRY